MTYANATTSANPAATYGAAAKTSLSAKAWSKAQDFEAVFIHSMFENMTTGIDGEGPFGGGPAAGVWRSFLTQEYAKSFAKAGGIGLAAHVYDSLMAHQEAHSGNPAGSKVAVPTTAFPITVPTTASTTVMPRIPR
jgi:Rod binding domain-containing protein